MLAWVCWDEFVNLKSPYTVRWMEKCNEPHIAALRIIMRSTLSQAVASREFNIQPGSPETGHLMSALLMAAMGKLAAMRTTAPVELDKVEDTATRLMRGLFGNLLTIAGSGVRPQSMVWQLFGLSPQYDVPTKDVDWIWYETVVALYPYTSWPLKQFLENLEKLLDKVIVRVITKNEKVKDIKSLYAKLLGEYCRARNIQLDHSRTIITIFMRILTTKDIDVVAVATRLLEHLPKRLENQTQSYTKMIKYLQHLSKGGQRRANDDLVAAMVYNKRSAAFSELKAKVSEACSNNEWEKMKEFCQELVDQHAEISVLWNVKPEALKIQNLQAYRDLLDAEFGEQIDEETKTKNLGLTRKVIGDAEKKRVPWQVGKKGEFGDDIEPLDEGFLHEILTGEKLESVVAIESEGQGETATTATTAAIEKKMEDEFENFSSSLQTSFIGTMQKNLSAEDVCGIMKVPVSAMRVFIRALNREFVWEDLAQNFKEVILGLLKNRSGRAESRPVRSLLRLESRDKKLQIEE